MIDLHLHLDGSIKPETIIEIAKKENVKLPTYDPIELSSYIKCPMECESLNEYLTKFEIPGIIMQTKYAIEKTTYELIKELAAQKLIYAEIRFAPQLHTNKGLTQEEVLQSAISGLNCAMKDYNIKCQLILCLMRGDKNHKENIETVNLAKKYLNKGVCAIDLAGAEGLFKTHTFSEEFKLAKELNIPFTIHAGESDSIDSIKCAISFGAKRIGHGIRAVDSEEFMEFLAKNKIGIEMCPTSNLQTKAVKSMDEYPLRTFLKHNMKATVNTDNMTVSDTTISNEFELLEKEIKLTKEEKIQLLKNSVEIAFLSENEKKELLKEMNI